MRQNRLTGPHPGLPPGRFQPRVPVSPEGIQFRPGFRGTAVSPSSSACPWHPVVSVTREGDVCQCSVWDAQEPGHLHCLLVGATGMTRGSAVGLDPGPPSSLDRGQRERSFRKGAFRKQLWKTEVHSPHLTPMPLRHWYKLSVSFP